MGNPPQPVPFSTLRDGDLYQWPGGSAVWQRVDRTHFRSYPDVVGAGHGPVRPLNATDTWVVPLRRWEPIRLDAPDPNATATPAPTTNDPNVPVLRTIDDSALIFGPVNPDVRAKGRWWPVEVWQPEFRMAKLGEHIVTNVSYPNGTLGRVRRLSPASSRWLIVNDPTVTVFPTRDTAARAERVLTEFLKATLARPDETHTTPTENPNG